MAILVNLTVSEMNSNPEMEGTLVIQILRQEHNKSLIQTLRLKGIPLIWATLSVGSLYKDSGRMKGLFILCTLALTFLAHPVPLGFQHI